MRNVVGFSWLIVFLNISFHHELIMKVRLSAWSYEENTVKMKVAKDKRVFL